MSDTPAARLDAGTQFEVSVGTAISLMDARVEPEVLVRKHAGVKASAQREGRHVRFTVSEAWTHAPEEARVGLFVWLLERVLKARAPARAQVFLEAYNRFSASKATADLHESLRALHGRGSGSDRQGAHVDLERELDLVLYQDAQQLGPLAKGRPSIRWSHHRSRSRLGFYDAAFHTVVLSRRLDSPSVPLNVIRYVIFHELLHAKHDVQYERGVSLRRTVHPRAFKLDEKAWPGYDDAVAWLKTHRW